MSSIVISGDTSGSVTLQAPATAGSTTLTLPAVSGTVVLNNSADQTINGLTVGKGSGLIATNTAIGASALNGNSSGTGVTAVGSSALLVSTGSNNTAVGRVAGTNTTSGTDNAFFGMQSGYTNITGVSNVYVGISAGYTATGSYNTFLGQGSGETISSGAKNSILGRYNGNQGGLDIRTASNMCVISDGDGNPFIVSGILGSLRCTYLGDQPSVGYIANAALVITYLGSAHPAMRTYDTTTGSTASTAWNLIRNGSSVGQIYTTDTATAYVTSSDYRLKKNVVPMSNALDTVSKLNPVTYKWKSSDKAGQGFIAHEMQDVFPEAVYGTKDGVDADGNPEYQGIDTSFLVATLTAAIKELNAKVIELEAKLESK